MNDKLTFYLEEIEKYDKGATDDSIRELQNQLNFEIPEEYISVMKQFNGGEGEVGDNSWLVLFPIEDLMQTNKDYYLLMEQISEYFLFGKDAADTGYAFHKLNKTFHSFGLMSDFEKDGIEFGGNSFSGFLEYLYDQ